jgi:hypothetical protein
MCPFCISTAAIIAVSAASGGSGAFLVMRKRSSKAAHQSTAETITNNPKEKSHE